MNFDNGSHSEAEPSALRARFAPGALPQVSDSSPLVGAKETNGVSTDCAHFVGGGVKLPFGKSIPAPPAWYALRVTYGRVKQAYDYLVDKGVEAFCPMHKVYVQVGGKRRAVMRAVLPNIFFAFGTEAEIQSYVYDNVNLPYLRFYYRHLHEGKRIRKVPLLVPEAQIETFRIICRCAEDDTFFTPDEIRLFERGEEVRVTRGPFAGVKGRVARFKGQQRVGIYIDGVATVATAYVPNAYLEKA